MVAKLRKIAEKRDKQHQRLDDLIARRFAASNMSDTKWVKLLKSVAVFAEKVPYLTVKLVYGADIQHTFTQSDPEHVDDFWFREPIIYKEIEWLEFPKVQRIVISEGVSTDFYQDLNDLKAYLESIAHFPLEESDTGLRVVGYVAKSELSIK